MPTSHLHLDDSLPVPKPAPNDGAYVLDRSWRIVDINEPALEQLGVSRSEAIGTTLWILAPGLVGTACETHYRLAMESRTVEEFVGPSAAHESRWLEVRAFPVPEGLAVHMRDVTHRVELEAKLRDREQLLSAIFGQAGAGFAQVDLEGRFELVNDAYCAITGYSREQLLGQRMQDITHPDDLTGNLELLKGALAGKNSFTIEKRYVRPDGSIVWVNNSVTILRSDAGAPIGILAVTTDRTEARRSEQQLRESEQRFRQMADAVPQIVWITDAEGRTEFFNRQWSDYTGVAYQPTTAAQVAATHVHPEDASATVIAFDEARRTGTTFHVEHRIRSKSGEYRWFLVRGEPHRHPDTGEIVRWFGASVDIHDRKEAEARLLESEARFRNMADHAPVMMWVTDAFGYCTYLNRRWYEFTGQADRAGEGYGWLDAVHPDDRGAAEQAFISANADRHDYRVDFRLRRADGVYRWTIDAAAARFGPDGEYLGHVGSVIDIDDRREVENALRESEERLRLAVENAEIGFWDVDVVNDVLIWPPRTKAMFGISPHVPVSMQDFYDGLHSDDREATSTTFAAAADPAVRALYDVDYRTIGKEDGIVRWVSAKGRGLFDGPGETARCLRVIGTAIDITTRKATEERLRELNETLERRVAEAIADKSLLAELVEGTDAFVQVADRQFRWLAINKAAADEFERIFGVRPTVGQSMLDALADKPEHQEAVRAVWSRALDGQEFTEVGEFGDPGLDRRFYEMKYNVLRDADGVVTGAYQFVYDVTQRIQEQRRLAEAEAARREADALYRAYFENTAEALFVVNVLEDGGFTVEDLNPAHQASIGLPLPEVKGKRLDTILPPDTAATVIEHYRRVIAAGCVYQYRDTFNLNGRTTHWDTVLVPVRDRSGRIVRLIGSSRDLTAQLAAEEQLRQSQKLEAMGQLTGGVAHDFNNLLTPIIGSLDMLTRKGVGNERERRLIDGALQSAERAKTLVQRLLAFARRQPLQPTAVDLHGVVEAMAGLVGSTMGPTIDLKVDLEPNLPPVTADPNQLEMALLNLAVNARDAMPSGGVLTIGAKRKRADSRHLAKLSAGEYVVLAVADTGVGMDDITVARAIEPFFSTKGIGKGTGLGLSMVHGLVAQLGGALTIDSMPGQGTRIELWLPISVEPVSASGEKAAAVEVRRGRGTALLVDDEELVRMSTADMLIELGFNVVEAGSAEDACRVVNAGTSPDLLVTDHLMPGMSGADLAHELRVRRPDLPVLIVSGYAEADGLAPDLPRLTKPFRNSELAAKVDEVLQSKLN
jgi:PAS domain S-box-containing protein